MLFFRLPVYLALISVAHSIHFYRRSLARDQSLGQANLAALKMQLQPHFLFNSLNAIAALVQLNPEAADEIIVALSSLLRLSLDPAAVEAVRAHTPDLLLLDVQMPGMDGFETLRALDADRLPEVVFVTGFDQHAVRAFEARALDYLLKPTTRARLIKSLNRVREKLAATSATPALSQALLDLLAERAALASTPRVRRLAFRTGERVVFVAVEDVERVEAAGNYAILHVGRVTHILRETMGSLEGQLAGETFLRVSRSTILNLRRVQELQSVAPGENVAVLTDGQRVPMTRSLREVEERLRGVITKNGSARIPSHRLTDVNDAGGNARPPQ